MIIQPRTLDTWLRDARDGDVLHYARATCLAPTIVTKRLYELATSGHVLLTRTRRMHGGGEENFVYSARRTAKPLPGQAYAVKGVKPIAEAPPVKPQDKRYGAHASVMREIAPQVRSLLAEGAPRNACAIARALGLYSSHPVQKVLERLDVVGLSGGQAERRAA